jgi:hypothetical protein
MTLGCAAASQARAESWFQFEAGIGGSAYQRAGDGLWVQNGFEHQLNLTAPAIEAGIAVNVAQWQRVGITLHANYEWLATVHTQSMATPSDANYNVKTQSCNGPCWPLADYMTSGHDYGFALMVEPHYDLGNWRFGVAGGPYLHKSPFSVDVTNWVSSPTATPINLHVENNAGWQLGYVIGANISYKNFGLAYRYFANGGHVSAPTPYPPVWRATHVLMATYRF